MPGVRGWVLRRHFDRNDSVTDHSRTFTLRDYVRVLREQRWLILFVTILFVGAALFVSLRADEKYRSEAKLLFREPNQDTDPLGTALPARLTAEQRSIVGAEQVSSTRTAKEVSRRLGGQPFNASVSAKPELRSALVIISTTSTDPVRAALVANTYADASVAIARKDYTNQINALIRQARREFRSLRRSSESFIRADQARKIGQLRILRQLGNPVELTRRATVSAAPFSPRPVRNTIFGLVGGLSVAILLAFLRNGLDRRLRSPADVRDVAAMPLLGAMRGEALGGCRCRRRRRQGQLPAGPRGRCAIIRRNLDFLDIDGQVLTGARHLRGAGGGQVDGRCRAWRSPPRSPAAARC